MKSLIILSLLTLFACNNAKKETKIDIKKVKAEKVEVKNNLKTQKQESELTKTQKEDSAKKVVKKRSEKVFMWKVKSKTSTMYMLGSIHLGKSDTYPLDQRIEDAYEKSDAIVVEVNMKKGMAEMQAAALKLSMYKDGKTLKDDIPKDLYDKLIAIAEKSGLPESMIQKFKPFMATLTILTIELSKLGYSSFFGIDMHFLNAAQKDKKEILELESGIEQLNMLASFSKEVNIENIKLFIENWGNLESDFTSLFKAWENGDYDKVKEFSFKDMNKHPKLKPFYQKLFFDRNAKMAQKLKKYLATDKNYFVTVGSAHFVGDGGILDILKKEGFTVEQQ